MTYALEKILVVPLLKLWLRKADGLENIPRQGEFIIAANHTSYFETLLVPSIIASELGTQMHAFVNSSYWSNLITRAFLDHWKGIPVFSNKTKDFKEKNKQAVERALEYLKRKEIMIVFPEGHRSPDGKLQKAYAGCARLALSSKAPVLPIGVIGADKILPRGKIFPRFKRCEVKIGKPIYFGKYYKKKVTAKDFESITRLIMKEIAKLIGQKYNY